MILIVLKLPVRPERAEEFVGLASEYARVVQSEEGNVFFQWSRSIDAPDTFISVEGFRDSDAGKAHTGTQHFRDFVASAPDIVSAQPEMLYVDSPDLTGWRPMAQIQPRA